MKRWLAAICAAVLFGMLWRVPAVCAAEEPEIPAAAYALMETETGTLLLESHSGDRLACGAMAKLMTAYLAAEQVERGLPRAAVIDQRRPHALLLYLLGRDVPAVTVE